MVAIVSGNSVGLSNTSAGTLGQNGIFGQATNGTAKDAAYVNIATGNLSLQDRDDFIASNGIDVAFARTYNSQALLNSGFGAGWQFSQRKQISGLTGTVNTAGSTVNRVDADGAVSLYTYDAARAAYVCTDGGGAYQTLIYSSGAAQWTWRADHNDLQGVYELYAGATGLMVKAGDQLGVRLTLLYSGTQLVRMQDARLDIIEFGYTAGQLSKITVSLAELSDKQTRVTYLYDTSNRLKSVTTDLTPDDSTDSVSYVVGYTYLGTTSLVETVTQSDGSSLTFSYVNAGGKDKVASVTDALGRKTIFDYTVASQTTVTDHLGYKTVYGYDAKGQLLTVAAPAVGGVASVTRFFYDGAGNVQQTVDARNVATVYGYDSNGNRTLERDSLGNTITRVYSASNNLLSETRYTDVDPDGAGSLVPTKKLTTRYAYDAANRLRFVIGAEGTVQEHQYGSDGLRTVTLNYLDSKIADGSAESVYAFAAMVSWSQTAAVKNGNAGRTEFRYDPRGLLFRTISYSTTLGAAAAAPVSGEIVVQRLTYDARGNVIESTDGAGALSSYTYDGLGRQLSATDALLNTTLNTYDDAGNRIVTRRADGSTSTAIYDRAGQLSAQVLAAAGGAVAGVTGYLYDGAGRLRTVTDPNGGRSHLLYDEAGRKVAQVSPAGSVTEFRYDAANRLLQTIVYATPANASALAALVGADGRPANLTLAQSGVLPPVSAADQSQWRLYDDANRLSKSVDALGVVTDYSYDGAARLLQTVRRALAVNVAAFAANPVAANASPAANPGDRSVRNAYDKQGRLRFTLDGEGYLTEFRYDNAGHQLQRIAYAIPASAATRASADWALAAIATSSADVRSTAVYNGRGLASSQTDGAGNVTTLTYDGADRLLTSTTAGVQTRYVYDKLGRMIEQHLDATGINAASKVAYDSLGNKIAVTDAAGATTQFVYDTSARLIFTIDALGRVSEDRYDLNGNVVETVRYARAIDPARVNTVDKNTNTVSSINGSLIGTYTAIDSAKSYKIRARVRQVSGSGQVYVGVATKDAAGNELRNTSGPAYSYPGIASFPLTAEMGWTEFEGTISGELAAGQYDKYKFLNGSKSAAPLLLYNYAGQTGADGSARVEVDYLELIDVASGTVLNLNGQMAAGTSGWNDVAGLSNALSVATVRAMLGAPDALRDVHALNRYDSAGRLTWSIDGTGAATQITYDAKGNMVGKIAYARPLGAANLAAMMADPRAMPLPGSDFLVTHFVYDAENRLVFTIDPLGSVSETRYDSLGNVSETVRYAKPINAAWAGTTDGGGAVFGGVEGFLYGSVAPVDVNKTYTVRARLRQVSGAGNVYVGALTCDANGVKLANAGGSTYSYAGGAGIRLTPEMGWQTFEGQLSGEFVGGTGTYNPNKFIAGTKSATGMILYNYSSSAGVGGAPTVEVDYIELIDNATGTVLNPNAGMTSGTAGWAGATGTATVRTVANVRAALQADAANDVHTVDRYDSKGRLTWSIDAAGAATQIGYDARGNVLSRITYKQALSAAEIAALVQNPALAPAPAGAGSATRYVYDANNRLQFTIDALGAVSERKYDAIGNVVDTVHYATLHPALAASAAPDMTTLIRDAARDTHAIQRYDSLGRLIWSVNPSGAATQFCYDAVGNLVSKIAYRTVLTGAMIDALVADPLKMPIGSSLFNATNFVYDAGRRLVFTIDPLGGVSEARYDALDRLVETVRYANAIDPARLKTTDGSTLKSTAIQTALTGTVSAIDSARTYRVRARVRQVSGQGTVFLGVISYNAASQTLSDNGRYSYPGSSMSLTAADGWQTLEGDISGQYVPGTDAYDAHKFMSGSVSATPLLLYNYYGISQLDGAPQVEVDYLELIDVATGKILNQNSAMAQGLAAWSMPAATVSTLDVARVRSLLAGDTGDAHEYQRYDDNGRLTWTIDAGGAATQIVYDAFGNAVIRTSYSQLLGSAALAALAADPDAVPAPGGAASTTRYVFDADNRPVFTIDALNAVTETRYDALGRVVASVRYATALTAPVAAGTSAAGVKALLAAVRNDALDAMQVQRYDSAGRLTWSIDATGSALQICYDALGNVVSRISYTTPLPAAALAKLAADPAVMPVPSGGINVTNYVYDADRRLIYTIDPVGAVTETRYDAFDKVVETVRYAKPIDTLRYRTTDGSTVSSSAVETNFTSSTVSAIDTSKTYRVRARVRQVSGIGTFYLGAVTYNSANLPIANVGGANYAYPGGSKRMTAADGWQVLEGDISGEYAQSPSNYNANKFFAGSKSATPLLIYNYSSQPQVDGPPKVEVDYIELIDLASGQVLNPNSSMVQGTTSWNVSATAFSLDATALQSLLTPGAADAHAFQRYDKNGRLLWSVDPNGAATQFNYDADGNATGRVAYTEALSAAQMAAMVGKPSVLPAPSAGADATRNFYDANDRLVYAVDALGAVTEHRYDALGRDIDTVRYAKLLPAPLSNASDLASVRALIASVKDDARDAHQLQRYDTKGRLCWSVSAIGGVIKFNYDADGNLTSRLAYKTALTPAAIAALVAAPAAVPAPAPGADVSTYVYDADRQLVYSIDPTGAVSENRYDARGKVVETVRYFKPLDPLALNGLALAALKNLVQPDALRDIHQFQRFDNDGHLTWSIDALGAVTERRYDAAGRVSQIIGYGNGLQRTLAPGAVPSVGSSVPADGAYVLTSTQDRVTLFQYDAAGRVVSQTDAAGTGEASTQSWAYDVAGNVIRHTDARGSVSWSAYDAGNRLVRSIDALGYATVRTYYADSKVKTETRYATPVALPAAANDAWAYDNASNPVTNTDPVKGDQVQSWTYDADGRMQTFVDGMGGVTKYVYDAVGNLTDSTVAFGTGAAATVHLTYDQAARVVSETRAYGTADSSTTVYGYDTWGNQTSILAAGLTTYQRFDGAGRKTGVTNSDGVTTTVYNNFGDIVKVIDARGNAGYFYPDALGRTTMQVDPEGAVSETRYDLRGNVTHTIRYKNKVQGAVNESTRPAVVSAGGSGVYVLQSQLDQYQQSYYDALGRKSSMRTYYNDTAYYTEGYTYDANGNVRTMTARNGAVTTYDYDKNNRLILETLPVTSKNASNVEVPVQNRLEYDGRGNITKRIEAFGLPEQRVTTYIFDKLNRQTKEIGEAISTFDPVTKLDVLVTPTKEHKFDARGNLVEEVDARGARTLHFFDAANRETGRLDPLGTFTRVAYDAAGNKASQTIYANPVQVVGGGLAPNNAAPVLLAPGAALPASGAYLRTDAAQDRSTSYAYDGAGRVKTTTGDVVTLGNFNPLSGQYNTRSAAVVTKRFYDANGNLVKQIDGNGNVTRSYYDKAGNLAGQLDARRFLTLYQRDAFGNVSTQCSYATALPAAVVVDDNTTLSQLSVATSAQDRTTRFTYDRLGRTLSESLLGVAYGTVDATTGALVEATGDATTTYSYDGLSNVASKTDANGGVTDWVYDALGRKQRELQAGFSDYRGVTVRITTDIEYNGLDQVRRQLIRGEDNASETDDRITRYEYGAGGFLLAQTDATMARTEFRVDAAGSITRKTLVDRVDANGAKVNDVTWFWYDAAGREVRHTDAATGTAVETRYNGFGEVTGKRTNPVANSSPWTEFSDYDRMGRAWRSNAGDGITKVFVYDANGNATLKLDHATVDLRDTLPDAPSQKVWTLLDALTVADSNQTYSMFDARNQLTDTIQPEMKGGHGVITVEEALVQRGGTSFAGVGDMTMGVAAGLGSAGTAAMPSAPGSATITRGQSVNASLTDNYHVSTSYYGNKTVTLAEHTLSLNIPDTSAWGSGLVRIDISLDSTGPLEGYQGSFYPGAGASTGTFTFKEFIEPDGPPSQPRARSFTYTIFKEGNGAPIKLATYTWGRPSPVDGKVTVTGTTTAGSNVIHLGDQKSETRQVIMMLRPAGSTGGWTMINVPKAVIGGAPQDGQFELDWTSFQPGSYEFRYVALSDSNDVLNSQAGTMTLGGAPAISQSSRLIGGAGRAFVDASGAFVFNEFSGLATSAVLSYRPVGSAAAPSVVTLNAVSVGGAVVPGWFNFSPAGLSGNYEYTIDIRNAANATLSKSTSTFTAGAGAVVNDPSGLSVQASPTASVNLTVQAPSTVQASFYRVTRLKTMMGPFNEPYQVALAPSTSLTVALPDTNAWGTGRVRIDVSMSGSSSIDGSYGGFSGSFYASNGAQSVVFDLPETFSGEGGNEAVKYSYTIYKETAGGVVTLCGAYNVDSKAGTYTSAGGVLTGRSTSAVPSSIGLNLVSFDVQSIGSPPVTPHRLLLEYRRVGDPGGWSVKAIPQLAIGGTALPGRFGCDWADFGWGGIFDYRTVAVDVAGNVLQTRSGRMALDATAANTPGPVDLSGGAGRVFMDKSGNLNITEQGPATSSLTIRYRAFGSENLWSTRTTLSTAWIDGAYVPGWFVFAPPAGAGKLEYVVEARNASGVVTGKTAGSFTPGSAAVSDLAAYVEPPVVTHFLNQPASAAVMRLKYKETSAQTYTEVVLQKVGNGMFDWMSGSVFSSDKDVKNFDYSFEARDSNGVLVNKAHGVVTLGASNNIASCIRDNSPTLASFSVPPGNDIAAQATTMVLLYRKAGENTPFKSVELSRTGDNPFIWDASVEVPPGSAGAIDYSYTLRNGATVLLRDEINPIFVDGTLTFGPTDSAKELRWLEAATVNTTALIRRSQTTNAFGEVETETNAKGDTTVSTYNTMGKLVRKDDPRINVTYSNGFQTSIAPRTSYVYDRTGRALATRDANGNLGTQSYTGGSSLQAGEFHADGGNKASRYDLFGDLRYSVDEIGLRTDYSYDKNGRLTLIRRPLRLDGARAEVYMTYDQAGNRITQAATPDAAALLSDYTTKTYYDSLGRVTQLLTPIGRSSTYSYVWDAAIKSTGGRATGGWRQTVYDPMGRSVIDEIDAFGRTTAHTDLGAHSFLYNYNTAGWLATQTGSTGQNIAYAYYANGYVKNIRDIALGTETQYEYDKVGNRTYEAYRRLVNGVTEFLQNTTIDYDSNNRVTRIRDPRSDIQYEYDAVGNRRRVLSSYNDGVSGSRVLQDFWYDYDNMNRFTITMGKLSSADGARGTSVTDTSIKVGLGAFGSEGVEVRYNKAGQRKVTISARDLHREDYVYGSEGYLEATYSGSNRDQQNGLLAQRFNDRLGRTTLYMEYPSGGGTAYQRATVYDAEGRQLSQTGTDGTTNYYYFNERMTDGGDSMHGIAANGKGELAAVLTTKEGAASISNYTTYEYWDTAKQRGQTIRGETNYRPDTAWRPGVSFFTYDINGHLATAVDAGKDGLKDQGGDDATFKYVSNAQGLVLRRERVQGTTVGMMHRYLYLNGAMVGDVGNDGDAHLDYAQTLARGPVNREEMYKNWRPVSSADFDQNYQPINASYPAATGSSYTVKSGDTLYAIAAAMWGDVSMWYLIADANGLTGESVLTAGQTLTIPNKVTNIHNNTGTMRPYDAGAIMGDVSPTLPDAPMPAMPKQPEGCGTIGMIIVVVVAIVVTIYAGPAAGDAILTASGGTAATATTAAVAGSISVETAAALGAAAGAAIGSVASQFVAMGLGMQESFSWKSVGTSALLAAIPGMKGIDNPVLKAMADAGIRNAAGQGLAMLAGDQKNFNWRSLAVSVVAAPLMSAIKEKISGSSWGKANAELSMVVGSAAKAVASGVLTMGMTGGRISWGAVAVDAVSDYVGTRLNYQAPGTPDMNPEIKLNVKVDAPAALPVGSVEESLARIPVVVDPLDEFAYTDSDRAEAEKDKAKNAAELNRSLEKGTRNVLMKNARRLALNDAALYKSAVDLPVDIYLPMDDLSVLLRTPQKSSFARPDFVSPFPTQEPPNLIEQYGGALEITFKGLWNAGVTSAGGLIGTTQAAFQGVDAGARTLSYMQKSLSWDLSSDSAKYVANNLANSPIIRGFEEVKSDTGDYYNDRYGPLAGALGKTAPDALLVLLPFGGKIATREFGSLKSLYSSIPDEFGQFAMPDGPSAATRFGGANKASYLVDPATTIDSPLPKPTWLGECFLAGTFVHTQEGLRAIETLDVGQWVAGRNEASNKTTWRRVVQLLRTEDQKAVEVVIQHLNGQLEAIRATLGHPFYVEGKKWRGAAELEVGDQVVLLDKALSTIISVRSLPGLHTVYNFEVEVDHTYFVGEQGVWVHNISRVSDALNEASGGANSTAAIENAAATRKSGFIFRGDDRVPDVIFNDGFEPQGTNLDLFNHAASNKNSAYVSTSTSPNVARTAPGVEEGGFVYTVRGQPNGVDVNSTLGSRSPFPKEFEIAVPGSIQSLDIMGARAIGPNGKFIGPFIKNPAYKP